MTERQRRIMVCWSPRDRQVTVVDPDMEPNDDSVLFGIHPGEDMDDFIRMLRHAESMAGKGN